MPSTPLIERDRRGELMAAGISQAGRGLSRGLEGALSNLEKRREEKKRAAQVAKAAKAYAKASGIIDPDDLELMSAEEIEATIDGLRHKRQEERYQEQHDMKLLNYLEEFDARALEGERDRAIQFAMEHFGPGSEGGTDEAQMLKVLTAQGVPVREQSQLLELAREFGARALEGERDRAIQFAMEHFGPGSEGGTDEAQMLKVLTAQGVPVREQSQLLELAREFGAEEFRPQVFDVPGLDNYKFVTQSPSGAGSMYPVRESPKAETGALSAGTMESMRKELKENRERLAEMEDLRLGPDFASQFQTPKQRERFLQEWDVLSRRREELMANLPEFNLGDPGPARERRTDPSARVGVKDPLGIR